MQAHPFHSSRLCYRAVEPSDDPFLRLLDEDSIAKMNGIAVAIKPDSSDTAKDTREFLNGAYVGVLVCLKEPELTPSGDGDDRKVKNMEGMHVQGKGYGEKHAIGWIALNKPPAVMAHHRESSVAVNFWAPYRGTGYGSEAFEWVFDYAFGLLGLHSVSVGCYEWNEGARRLYERMGLRLEGRKKQVKWFRGRWWDVFDFGILEDEWRERRKGTEFESKH